MRCPSGEYAGSWNAAGPLVRRWGTRRLRRGRRTDGRRRRCSTSCTRCTRRPGSTPARYSPTSMLVRRRGVPFGQSITYSRSSATNASCWPSGEGTASRICLTMNVAESAIGILEVHRRSERLHHLGLHRDLGRRASFDRHLPELSVPCRDQELRVRRERHAGVRVERRARLLVVALHRVDEPALFARFQVANAQPRLVDVARAVDQPPSVRRQRRTERRAPAILARGRFARFAIVDR